MTLRVTVLELPARHGAVDDAIVEVERLLFSPGAPHTDLVLLPEAGLTGYVSASGDFDLRPLAEPADGPTRARMAELAKRARAVIAFPLIERDGDRFFNAFSLIAPNKSLLGHYRKIHPWYPEQWATPGDLPMPVVTIDDVRLSLAVCFDIHFLETEQHEILESIDLLLFPSAWVDEDEDDLRTTILGRIAASHGITIANANWGVGEPRVPGQGRSRFVRPDGTALELSLDSNACRLDFDVAVSSPMSNDSEAEEATGRHEDGKA